MSNGCCYIATQLTEGICAAKPNNIIFLQKTYKETQENRIEELRYWANLVLSCIGNLNPSYKTGFGG